ncbi:5393_t:CDS:10 [Acaulospora morrowiae]|uniref:5393_t:CDS:1 n=1 Tax=Acaulospora morrowiae TaxID=94023 RepID=A0A9N8YTQ9_9GLOM|nr:5393_t:CDS:10 [Acaulospora morrowiae]
MSKCYIHGYITGIRTLSGTSGTRAHRSYIPLLVINLVRILGEEDIQETAGAFPSSMYSISVIGNRQPQNTIRHQSIQINSNIRMNISDFFQSLKQHVDRENGTKVAELLTIRAPFMQTLASHCEKFSVRKLETDAKRILEQPWNELILLYIKVITSISKRKYAEAFEEHLLLVQAFHKTNSSRWSLPILYVIDFDLRLLAIKSDLIFMMAEKPPKNLEIAARTINRTFSICITDRSPLATSRKWGTYYFAGLLFKTYFKLKQQNLCKNVMRSIKAASADLPGFEKFPKAHKVTFLYYHGLQLFLDAEYSSAEEKLVVAFRMCPKNSKKNKELILRYLIPIWLIRGVLPSREILSRYPRLNKLYKPFVDAIRDGNVKNFDDALAKNEMKLVSQNTFLTVELAREIAMRVLFKKVYLINNRESKIPLSKFHAALNYVGREVEMSEVMWFIASMIQKGLIRGHLQYSTQFLVLSTKNAFPWFG